MKQGFRVLGGACLLLALGTLRPAAQTLSVQAEMLKDWTGLKDTMDKIANAMPEDKFSYKSTPAQRDYGQQIMHVAHGASPARFKGVEIGSTS